MILKKMVKVINYIIPKKNIISFSSIPDYSDNSQAIFNYIIKNRTDISDKYDYVWHINDFQKKGLIKNIIDKEDSNINIKILKKGSLKSVWSFFRSKYIFSTHGMYNGITCFKKQNQIMLWHGMPLKTIGYMNKDDRKYGAPKGSYFSINGEIFKSIFEKSFLCEREKIHINGQPRNDYLLSRDIDEKKINNLFGYDFRKYKNIIFMPTYRKGNDGKGHIDSDIDDKKLFSISRDEWKEIDDILCKLDKKLIVKPHPLESLMNLNYLNDCKNIALINDYEILKNNLQLYQILSISDGLITDYSSVFIDYLLINKPIYFYISDFEQYKERRGFVFENVLENLPGCLCKNINDLIKCIESDDDLYIKKRENINNLYNDIKINISSEKILKDLGL